MTEACIRELLHDYAYRAWLTYQGVEPKEYLTVLEDVIVKKIVDAPNTETILSAVRAALKSLSEDNPCAGE